MSQKEKLNLLPFDPSLGRKDKKVPLTQVARMIAKRIGQKVSNNKNYKDQLKFKWVPVEKTYINYHRQRWPEPKHIQKLIDKWNVQVCTPLQARYDSKQDIYYIADGQQHGISWVIKYGLVSEVPVFYVDSPDENVESQQLLALNTDNEPMAKYFIHKQKIIMGDKWHTELENTVNEAGCKTGYKIYSAGSITHMTDLFNAAESYGMKSLGQVLSIYRRYWPDEPIKTATMFGFLKVKDIMEESKKYNDNTFEDVFHSCADFFESADRLHLDIKEEFERKYPTNYKGMGVREKIASGIIDVYSRTKGAVKLDKPFEIEMPSIDETVS
tara:strand:+ start:1469 stop:2449 length:981 start_codon:yes stop_codon:yes gene_type:complete